MIRFALAALAASLTAPVLADSIHDPLDNGMLEHRARQILGPEAALVEDSRILVHAPESAEDSAHVPVEVDASALEGVREIRVWADYGPIPHILTYRPVDAKARLSFRFKIDQATPVRAAVLTEDGVWRMGGAHIDAAGGGCTAPAAAYANSDWYDRLMMAQGALWPTSGRVRFVVDHPMDTGLNDGVPMFIIERLALKDIDGNVLAEIDLFEPVEEDPTFTLFVDPNRVTGPLRLVGRDNNGNEVDALIAALPAPSVGLVQ